jgi:CheY-like chemotaxis protein
MILIVDDKSENIYSLKKLLESRNFKVDTAFSGEEALKKILKNQYALIILDVQMPDMDGFEVAEAITGYSKSKDVPIIFLSAYNHKDKKYIIKGYESGAIDFVLKPIDTDILLLKVKMLHCLYSQTRELNTVQGELKKDEFLSIASHEIKTVLK